MRRPRHRPRPGRPGLSAHPPPRLQPLARAKAASLGELGAAWVAGLPRLLAELADQWELRLGRGLPGGSASFVCAAETADSEARVLKVVLPDPGLLDEAPVLTAAAGHGYVLLHAHDTGRRALLLERLGPSLEASGLPVETVLDVLADTLLEAWRAPAPADGPRGPLDRAAELWAAVEGWQRQTAAASPVVLRAAGAVAERLSVGDDPARHVVVHGDPHPANALRVLAPRPGAPADHVFVDPDGYRADPAVDVGITLRDWTSHLHGTTAADTLRRWTRRIAERTGVDADRAADWAYLERVSTGLYLASFGADRLSRRFLDSAAAMAR